MKFQTAAGGFKYEPRSMVAVRKQFGRSSALLQPAPGIDASDPRFLAAQLQHRVANGVREAALAQGLGLEALLANPMSGERPQATPPGMSYDRIVRINRGETLMQLADLMSWAQRFETVRELLADDQCWPTDPAESV